MDHAQGLIEAEGVVRGRGRTMDCMTLSPKFLSSREGIDSRAHAIEAVTGFYFGMPVLFNM
jgi:hypothetical protein